MRREVAVVITCYELGRTLPEALESVRAQTLPPAEVVIVDDGSEDPYTLHVLERLAASEDGVRVLRVEHGGPARARNLGVAQTTAPLAVLLDGDDLFESTYLDRAATLLAERPDLSFVCCALQAFGEASYRWKPPPYTVAEAIGRGACGHISTVFKRELWDQVGGFDSDLPAYEDVDFWLRALELGYRGAILDEALLRYRVRPGSRYHGAVVRGGYVAAKQGLLDRHAGPVAEHGEDVLVSLLDFEREVTGHARSLRHEELSIAEALEVVERDVVEVRGALQARGIEEINWGGLSSDGVTESDEDDSVLGYYAEAARREAGVELDGRRTQVVAAGDEWPAETKAYDAIVVVRALEAARDPESAVAACRAALRPGGRLLVLASPLAAWADRSLGLTEGSLRALLCESFPPGAVSVTGHGNLVSSLACLAGAPAANLDAADLEVRDPLYPVLIAGVADAPRRSRRKRADGGGPFTAPPRPSRPVAAGAILAYHRIADHQPDVHGLCTPPEVFSSHMELLAERFRPVPLPELADQVRRGPVEPGSVAVTFDDGYVDNLDIASPLLEKHGIPATFFVTGPLDDEYRETWADIVERILSGQRTVPDVLRVELDGSLIELPTSTSEERSRAARILHGRLLPAKASQIDEAIGALVAWSGRDLDARESHRLMTAAELRTLSERPGHELGAHGWDHLMLPAHPPEVRRRDLETIRDRLGELVELPVRSVAYPYGACDHETTAIAQSVGFTIGCSVEPEAVSAHSDPLRLPRIELHAEDANDLGFRLERAVGASA
jgi:peptidoglycan/xylan/chitin deacetylase (PgdA/CDA1 family)/SAM-dependent methyltransferase